MADDPADFGMKGLSLDDAMITYAYRSHSRVYVIFGWKEFKMFHNCEESPADLFARFWDDIMPNLKSYQIVKNTPMIADLLLCLPNPRKYALPPPKVYEHVKEMSLFEYEKLQAEVKQRKMFNDPKMLQLKTFCHDYMKKLQTEPPIQFETNRSTVEQSTMQRSRASSSDITTPRNSMPGIDQSIMEQPVSRVVPTNTGPISSTPLAGSGQRIRQSSGDAEASSGRPSHVKRGTMGQSSTSVVSPDVSTILHNNSERISDNESEISSKRRRSSDVE